MVLAWLTQRSLECGQSGSQEAWLSGALRTKHFFKSALTAGDAFLGSICSCSVAKSCLTLCDPMNCSTPGLPVPHQLPECAQVHVYWVGDAIQLSHPATSFSSHPQSFPASRSPPMSQLFASGDQSSGASASASVPPMNTQDWSPLGWTGWISLAVQGTLKSLLPHHSSKASI